MTENSITAQSPPRSNRECAMDLISAGNTLESVASVFGMTVEGLRSSIAQPAHTAPIDTTAPALALAQPWHRFPGNAVYRCPDYVPAIMLVLLLALLVDVSWELVFSPHHHPPRPAIVLLGLLMLVLAIASVLSWLSARAVRFEMHPDAVALHTLTGCTVLHHADIVGLTRFSTKGGKDEIQLLTRNGVGLTIAPRRVHLRDRRLAAWLDSIPESGDATQATADGAARWYEYILPVCQLILMIFVLGASIRNTYMGNMSTWWPTTDGIVTESVSLSNGGKGCRYPLRFHYRYTVEHKQYVGDNYRFSGVCGSDSRSIAAGNPVGKHLIVHYRPRDPAQSVIVPGGGSYLFGMISLGVAATALVFAWRARSR